MDNDKEILQSFSDRKTDFDKINNRIYSLVAQLLESRKNIKIHQITCRVKSISRLEAKLKKKRKYERLEDVTDLSGIRVICYFEEDVDLVSSLLEKEFEIDEKNSVDKRQLRDSEFGYKSLHYVVELNAKRKGLTEYQGVEGLKTEIQVRSILQHAWAEIEHGLGYTSKQQLPYSYRRAFNRNAAVLESVDVEFSRLKRDLENYEADIHELFKGDLSEIMIDKPSVDYFLQNDEDLHRIEAEMAKETQVPLETEGGNSEQLVYLIDEFGISNIQELKSALASHEKFIIDEAKEARQAKRTSGLSGYSRGVALFHMFMRMPDDRKKA